MDWLRGEGGGGRGGEGGIRDCGREKGEWIGLEIGVELMMGWMGYCVFERCV